MKTFAVSGHCPPHISRNTTRKDTAMKLATVALAAAIAIASTAAQAQVEVRAEPIAFFQRNSSTFIDELNSAGCPTLRCSKPLGRRYLYCRDARTGRSELLLMPDSASARGAFTDAARAGREKS